MAASIGVSTFGFLPDFPSGHAIRLIGGPSQFAESLLWSVRDNQDLTIQLVVERENKTASFNPANTDKQYRIRLAVTNQFARAPGISGFNDIAEAVVFTDRTLRPLNFINDIYPLLTARFPHDRNSSGGDASCVECHSTNVIRGRANGIFNLSLPDVNDERSFAYDMVRTRIDCNDPENSLILKKPAGRHHYAGTVQGFEHVPSNEFFPNGERRETVLRWIMEGAPLDDSGPMFGCPLPPPVSPNP